MHRLGKGIKLSNPSDQFKIDKIKMDMISPKAKKAIQLSGEALLQTNSLRMKIWPKYKNSYNPCLVLLPLDRIGAKAGFSGSGVFIGYFTNCDKISAKYRSHPVVVKIDPRTNEAAINFSHIKSKYFTSAAAELGHFAYPIYFHKKSKKRIHSVLWSPFYSAKQVGLIVDSLYDHLGRDRADSLRACISNVYSLLKPLHCEGKDNVRRSKDKINIATLYQRYLRKYDAKKGWGQRWSQIWPDSKVSLFCDNWPNPINIYNGLCNHKMFPLLGAIHGDIHPRNIVLTSAGQPCLIDFGWYEEQDHIVKDFILLECNLRFMALKAEQSIEGLMNMAMSISTDNIKSCIEKNKDASKDICCYDNLKLIALIRDIAKDRFPDNFDWDHEYIIPLFLVAFGLLSKFQNGDNQIAHLLTVLTLAKYIDNI